MKWLARSALVLLLLLSAVAAGHAHDERPPMTPAFASEIVGSMPSGAMTCTGCAGHHHFSPEYLWLHAVTLPPVTVAVIAAHLRDASGDTLDVSIGIDEPPKLTS